jgi:protein-S-isoprenylcysteine O-methyltransferase Ste14
MLDHRYFVISAFIVLAVSLYLAGRMVRKAGISVRGVPSIDPVFFYSGKLLLFVSLALFAAKAIIPDFGYIQVPIAIAWSATAILWLSTLWIVTALHQMGTSLFIGLPSSETSLKTKGLFSISRNPLYTGIHFIAIASCLYFPDLINITFTIYGIVVHHYIIRGEEKFLQMRFGEHWENYRKKVRRYL